MPDHIKTYIKAIERELKVGQATEHTHRHALKKLIESISPQITATNEPKRVKCGAPDFLVSKARQGLTIGYIETKDIGKSLDEAEKSGQLKRYRRSLENLILTDYLEFRWYVDGELRDKAGLAGMVKPEKLARDREDEAQVLELLKNFLGHPPARVGTPQELAGRMARLTHMIRDITIEAFETNQASPLLAELRQAFARTLIPDLDTPAKTAEFADMYAQTMAYGLFAARCNHQEALPFKRLGAAGEIPRTNPFLRRLFETITGTELDDEPYAGFVDDLVQLFDHADMEAVLEHFGRRTRNRDPVVHFYETFLAEYDPKLREKRGVYYTPEAVVSYIVHSVDQILKDRFDCPQGLADTSTISYTREDGTHHETPKVLILDPACGTGTFLYTVVDLIRDQFMKRRDAGMWSGYVREHLLPRLFGFELLMAPYAVAHFKLGMQLAGQDMIPLQRDTWRYDFASHERLGVYLTNTLEEAERATQREMYFLERTIAEEAGSAAEIKNDLPIMVIMGNPPYSGHSANRSQYDQKVQKNEEYITGWTAGPNGTASPLKTTAKHEGVKKQPTFINRLVKDYFVCNGEWLQERNPKWLQDDYVKFIRWAQWRIERTGAGVLGFITNHGYLDNPTFRGMRWQLMKAFSEIYILDLHGNAKKKEVSPDGSKDENVFDIQQGVSIGIF
ncbi:MAG: N-6 DNA methylase, partial [Thermodesulfobacteriota bacterium]|nr:N-6 DNA methylase [Thermodesulfobacteriota bacterium]